MTIEITFEGVNIHVPEGTTTEELRAVFNYEKLHRAVLKELNKAHPDIEIPKDQNIYIEVR